ncbi:restriction endonuclease subunit S [Ponticoccus gilvus]|nr:restriction endonuclease subunit S [Enemella evansiae]
MMSTVPLKRAVRLITRRGTTKPDLPFIGLEHIKGWTGQINFETDAEAEGTVGLFEAGDILFGKLRPYLAKVALPRFRGTCSTEALILRPNKGHDPRFLRYALSTPEVIERINGTTFGAKMPRASWENIGREKIPAPDFETQKAIADFLDRETTRIDALVEKRHAFNELLDEVAKSLIADAINGGLIESQERQDAAWLGTVPKTWDIRRMRFIYRERVGRSETGEEELLSASHLTGVTKRSEKEVNMFLAESNVGYKKVMRNDLVVNTMWAWMGAMGISPEEGIISPSYGVYRPIDQRLSPEFADLVVRSPQFIAEATRRSKGIHSSRLRLYTDALYDIVFPVPPLDDQAHLVEQLARRRSRENALREKNEQAIALLQELRAAMITAAVTGQIDPDTYRRNGTTDRALDRIAEEMTQ